MGRLNFCIEEVGDLISGLAEYFTRRNYVAFCLDVRDEIVRDCQPFKGCFVLVLVVTIWKAREIGLGVLKSY